MVKILGYNICDKTIIFQYFGNVKRYLTKFLHLEELGVFAQILAYLLKSRNMNPLSLAKQIGVPKSIVYEWRQGVREPSMENLLRLSDFFGVSLEYLTGRSELENPEYSDDEAESELLLLLRAAKKISEEDHNALIRSFKANLDIYLSSTNKKKSNRQLIENEALQLLLKQDIMGEFSLCFFDMRKIKTGGIATIDSISSYEERVGTTFPFRTDGMTLKKGDLNMIFYDERVKSRERINWTIAHELGHIILGHTDSSEANEHQADMFAASLLIPEAVVRFLDCQNGSPISPEEMTKYFPASLTACQRRRSELSPDESYVPTKEGNELVGRLFNPTGK